MLTRNAVMIVPAVLCAFRLWADTVEVSNDTEIESLPADVATLEYTGAGLLTITGARPIDSTTTTSVTFNCPVRFTAAEATLVLRNGQINFAKPVSFVQLRSEAKKISIQGTATVSGTKLDIIGLDTLNSDITTTSLVVENGTDALPNRLSLSHTHTHTHEQRWAHSPKETNVCVYPSHLLWLSCRRSSKKLI